MTNQEKTEALKNAQKQSKTVQKPSQKTAKGQSPIDSGKASQAFSNSISNVNNKLATIRTNVEAKIQQMAEVRDQRLDEYAQAITYLNDGDAFVAELLERVEELSQPQPEAIEVPVIDLDVLDPYTEREFVFRGRFFKASPISLLGGN